MVEKDEDSYVKKKDKKKDKVEKKKDGKVKKFKYVIVFSKVEELFDLEFVLDKKRRFFFLFGRNIVELIIITELNMGSLVLIKFYFIVRGWKNKKSFIYYLCLNFRFVY